MEGTTNNERSGLPTDIAYWDDMRARRKVEQVRSQRTRELAELEARCSHCGLIQDSTYGKKLRAIFERPKHVCAGCGIPLLPPGVRLLREIGRYGT